MCAMRILKTMRRQPAWIWNNPVPDGYGGFSYDAPVHEKVRWEDKREKFFSAAGEELTSSAIVYTGIDVKEGAMLLLDENWADSSGSVPADPTDSGVDAWPVRAFDKLPTLKADGYLRTCFM